MVQTPGTGGHPRRAVGKLAYIRGSVKRFYASWIKDSGMLLTLIPVSMDSAKGNHFSVGQRISRWNWGAYKLCTYHAAFSSDLWLPRELKHYYKSFSYFLLILPDLNVYHPEWAIDTMFLPSAVHWLRAESHPITLCTTKLKNRSSFLLMNLIFKLIVL